MYDFTLTSMTPLLMHADDVMEADGLMEWRKNPKNKPLSVPGDDRSPPWTWQAYLYHDGERLALPGEPIMAALLYAGARVPLKGQTTFKSLTQSGLLIQGEHVEFTTNGKPIMLADIYKLRDRPFSEQVDGARALGFDLFVKRAKVQSSKNVRVRARFDQWTVRGTIDVLEPAITPDVLAQLFEIAGQRAGLCDWRPSSPSKPGPFGMFTAELKAVKQGRKAG